MVALVTAQLPELVFSTEMERGPVQTQCSVKDDKGECLKYFAIRVTVNNESVDGATSVPVCDATEGAAKTLMSFTTGVVPNKLGAVRVFLTRAKADPDSGTKASLRGWVVTDEHTHGLNMRALRVELRPLAASAEARGFELTNPSGARAFGLVLIAAYRSRRLQFERVPRAFGSPPYLKPTAAIESELSLTSGIEDFFSLADIDVALQFGYYEGGDVYIVARCISDERARCASQQLKASVGEKFNMPKAKRYDPQHVSALWYADPNKKKAYIAATVLAQDGVLKLRRCGEFPKTAQEAQAQGDVFELDFSLTGDVKARAQAAVDKVMVFQARAEEFLSQQRAIRAAAAAGVAPAATAAPAARRAAAR